MSPVKNFEQLNTPSTSTFRERVASGELHFMTNFNQETLSYSEHMEQNNYINKLRVDYGIADVEVSNAMIDGQPDGRPSMVGVYVDAHKWAKLNPTCEMSLNKLD